MSPLRIFIILGSEWYNIHLQLLCLYCDLRSDSFGDKNNPTSFLEQPADKKQDVFYVLANVKQKEHR